MGFFDKLKSNNSVKKANIEVEDIYSTNLISNEAYIISMNDGVNICAQACACCWDTKLPDDYYDKAAYIGRRTKTGHTSVIEHSNVVFYLTVPEEKVEDLMTFLSINNYLHTVVKKSKKYAVYYLLVGGSWRAYSDLYLNCPDIHSNSVLLNITNAVFGYIPSNGMNDIIDAGILDMKMFSNVNTEYLAKSYSMEYMHRINENINIVNADSMSKLIEEINHYCDESYLFTYKDLLKLVTITVEFNGMSRVITQQLVRHRNAITQESQRYVDYSGAPFNSPAKYKVNYNPKKLYEIDFGGQRFKMNLQNLGNAINSIYSQLRDKRKLGDDTLVPEDARGYLALNTQCGKIYITFTYYNFIKFLQLREDNHAQAEIRGFAKILGSWFREAIAKNIPSWNKENNIYDALNPVMKDESFFSHRIDDTVDTSADLESQYVEVMTDDEYRQLAINSVIKEDEENKEK